MVNCKCYDVASMVIEEATDKFKDEYALNKYRLKQIEGYCILFDEMCEEFNGDSYTVEIDDDKDIRITLGCESFIVRDKNSPFYEALKNSKIAFFSEPSSKENENRNLGEEWVQFTLVYNGVWDLIE